MTTVTSTKFSFFLLKRSDMFQIRINRGEGGAYTSKGQENIRHKNWEIYNTK